MFKRNTYIFAFLLIALLVQIWIISSPLQLKQNEDKITALEEEREKLLAKVKELEEQTVINNAKTRSIAVVHMGMSKTGTTTIQAASKEFSAQIREDGYEMPWVSFLNHTGDFHTYLLRHMKFSTCFEPENNSDRLKYECSPEFLLSGLEIAKAKKNIFISGEGFARCDRDGLRFLSAYLSHWDDIKIIIYYRRLYDWLISSYNQRVKKRRTLSQPSEWDRSVVNHFTKNKFPIIPFHYTSEAIARAQEFFDNVVVVNMHDKSKGLAEKFYCDVLPNAAHTCEAVSNSENTRENGSIDVHYGTLVYGAKKRNLIEIKTEKQLKKASKAAREYHQDTLNLTQKDLKMKCLSHELNKWLFETSMSMEQRFFPEFFDLTEFKEDFDEKAKFDLCELDVEATLEEKEWKDFFESFAVEN